MNGNGCDGHISLGGDMSLEHLGIVHLIELIAAQNKDVLAIVLVKVAKVFANGVGGTLIPFRATLHRLLGGQ